jgi:Family of unknown function (DUF5678)
MTIKTPPRIRCADRPWKDSTQEMKWLTEHQHEYRGQYVLLVGDQLVAHGSNLKSLVDEAQTKGYDEPLVHFVPPDDPPFWSGIYE